MIVNLSRTLQMLPVVVLVTVALFGVPCGQGKASYYGQSAKRGVGYPLGSRAFCSPRDRASAHSVWRTKSSSCPRRSYATAGSETLRPQERRASDL